MNLHWFKRIGPFFLPKAFFGWIILIVAIAYSVFAFIKIDSHSHSASDTLRNFFFMLLIVGTVYSLIGFFTSRQTNS